MNKFRRILFRISAETYLKMDYFASEYPKSPTARRSIPRPPFEFNDKRMCKDPTPTEYFWLKQMLGNFRAK